MNIYEVKDGCPLKGKTEQMTEEELQKEYDFHIAESIVANLYKEGKITVDELHKISAKQAEILSPFSRYYVLKSLLLIAFRVMYVMGESEVR
ncbi:SHOCT domain-containing protein [Macrococcoides caseolyticum]|uniref:SHOCT domain-containing protein n=1 Tax=Macrococcoides caseolyticum TaxID=69966 RepID=UPI00116C93A7|nr:SHOCT domain-containing protein [Macrococcus caseolyticus]VUC73286.1 Uncharacterised protein [Macrococcus caseolyticus]